MRLKQRFYSWIVFILLIGLGYSLLFGGTTGKIAGRVIDKDTGQPLYGTNIVVEGTMLGASSDSDGNFIILRLPPGVYTIRAMMMGYGSVRVENIRISVDKTTRVDFDYSKTTHCTEGFDINRGSRELRCHR